MNMIDSKAIYIYNCVNYQELFDNATLMAQVVENSRVISKEDFYKYADVWACHKKIVKVKYSINKNLMILYDIVKDIHYFYL